MHRALLIRWMPFVILAGALVAPAPADAGYQEAKAQWHAFWARVHVDWHRNNAWPDPFRGAAEMSARQPLAVMMDNGWRLQNTLTNELFESETQKLSNAGRLKVKQIITVYPMHRRTVFVMRGRTDEVTAIRIKSVDEAVSTIHREGPVPHIAVTDIAPRGGSGAYYHRVNLGLENSAPTPRLPTMEAEGS